jgi:hypothetical protein
MTLPGWLRSTVDNYWHAVPTDQAADETRSSYTTACGTSMSAHEVERGEPVPSLLHFLCLITAGEPMPDDHHSETR